MRAGEGSLPHQVGSLSHQVGVTVAWRRHVDPRAHGEQIAAQIRAVLTDVGIRPAELGAIVAGTGPGPFTGLRVGLATAVAMGQVLAIPTYGVCSLDGFPSSVDPVLVATDARRREVYWAVYREGRALTEPAVDRPDAVVPALTVHGVQSGYGEGTLRYRDVLGLPVGSGGSGAGLPEPVPFPDPGVPEAPRLDPAVAEASRPGAGVPEAPRPDPGVAEAPRPDPGVPESALYPDPAVLARVAYPRIVAGAPGEPLVPRYLRRPDAAEPGPAKPATRPGAR